MAAASIDLVVADLPYGSQHARLDVGALVTCICTCICICMRTLHALHALHTLRALHDPRSRALRTPPRALQAHCCAG